MFEYRHANRLPATLTHRSHTISNQDSKRTGGEGRRGTPKVAASRSTFGPEKGGRADGGGGGTPRHDKTKNTPAASRAPPSPSPKTLPRNHKASPTALPWENLDRLQGMKGSLDPARMRQNAQRDKLDSLMGNTRYEPNTCPLLA